MHWGAQSLADPQPHPNLGALGRLQRVQQSAAWYLVAELPLLESPKGRAFRVRTARDRRQRTFPRPGNF